METKKFFSANNHLSENGIALYVDAIKLDQADKLPNTMVRHVEECEECAVQIMEVSELLSSEHYGKTKKHPYFSQKESTTSQFSTIYRVAAVLVIAAFIGTVYYVLTNRATDIMQEMKLTETEIQKQQPIPNNPANSERKQPAIKSTNTLLAANFEPSPNLEDLVETQFRSTTIEIVSPAIGEIVQTPVTFRWKQYEKQLTIKILSNKELTLVSSTLSGDSFTTTKKFAPGLYYWKLESANELLFVGRFLVK